MDTCGILLTQVVIFGNLKSQNFSSRGLPAEGPTEKRTGAKFVYFGKIMTSQLKKIE